MGEKTGIQWTDATWNPIRGCSRVSAGCMNCYAEKVAARFAYDQPIDHNKPPGPYFGLVNDRGGWNGRVDLIEDHLLDPLRWRKPRKIFVNSMSDLFHENVPDDWIDRIFAVMALASQHTFQVLTKRPTRMLKYMNEFCTAERNVMRAIEGEQLGGRDIDRHDVARALGCAEGVTYVDGINPPKNVWLGVSVENQEAADVRIPILLDTPAAVRFVSYEPALGPVNFAGMNHGDVLRGIGIEPRMPDGEPEQVQIESLDWIIVGGESGSGARRFDPAWARSVVRQCKAASVPVFVKQMGSNVIEAEMHWPGAKHWTDKLNRKGDDPVQWPEDLRVREFPI